MQYFPRDIVNSLRTLSSGITCLPVKLERDQWESAVFFEVGGNESKQDREILRATDSTFQVGIEADVITQETAAIVMLRFEIYTQPKSPLAGEVLLAPGKGEIQFDTLSHLTQQSHLRLFFGDRAFRIIHSQQISLVDEQRQGFKGLLDEAVNHDALIRLSGKYDAEKAMQSVMDYYQPKEVLHSS